MKNKKYQTVRTVSNFNHRKNRYTSCSLTYLVTCTSIKKKALIKQLCGP